MEEKDHSHVSVFQVDGTSVNKVVSCLLGILFETCREASIHIFYSIYTSKMLVCKIKFGFCFFFNIFCITFRSLQEIREHPY